MVWLVGKIAHQTNPLVEAWPNGGFGITSYPEHPPQSVPGHTQGLTIDASYPTEVQAAIARRRDEAPDRWDLPNAGSSSSCDPPPYTPLDNQHLAANSSQRVEYPPSSYVSCGTGVFANQTIRAEVIEIQKANVGKECVAVCSPHECYPTWATFTFRN